MPDFFFVYPAYLKRDASRALGRRVPTGAAVADATIQEIADAAKALGFSATAEPEKQYPREAHAYAGRVKVAKQGGVTKTVFLKRVAAELAKRRAAAGGTH